MPAAKPRIAVLSSYFPTREEPYRGHSAYQTLRRMLPWADISAVCPLPAYPSWYPLQPKEFRYRRMDLRYSPPDIPARYFRYRTLPLLTRPVHGLIVKRLVMPELRNLRPDLILSYWLYPDGYAAVAAAEQLGIPSIVGAIGSDIRRISDSCTRWWTRQTLHRASFVLTVSEELRSRVLDFGIPAEKTRAVLNGCDASIFHPGDRSAARTSLGVPLDAQVILYIGSLIPSKGLLELWEAFQRLALRRRRLRLVCVGEGPLDDTLAARAEQAGLLPRLLMPGQCGPADVARWLAACDLFCLPSHSEGCPNVVLEALASGRPVVATRVGGIPEIVDERCGILTPARDVDGLEAALERALSTPWNEVAISNQRQRGWGQVAAETWEVCQHLLA